LADVYKSFGLDGKVVERALDKIGLTLNANSAVVMMNAAGLTTSVAGGGLIAFRVLNELSYVGNYNFVVTSAGSGFQGGIFSAASATGIGYLGKQLGSKKDIPAVGSSIGVDRVVEAPWFNKLTPRIIKKPKIYFIQLGFDAKLKSLNVIEILRKGKVPIAQSISKDNLGSQLATAEKLGMRYVIIFGQKEALENSVIFRDMNNRSQNTVKISKLLEYIKEL
jgi:hypothetical protein